MTFDYLTSSTLNAFSDTVLHGFTLRNTPSFPKSVYKGFNLSTQVGDIEEVVLEHRNLIATQVFHTPSSVWFPQQSHGNKVVIVKHTTSPPELNDTDALVTQQSNVILGVLSADCVPILFWDPITKTIGAAHAGWKGTAKHIVKEVIYTMQHALGVQPSTLYVAIGPSISAEVYEVGQEVADQMDPASVYPKSNTTYCCDLWKENVGQLESSGVPLHHIDVLEKCTYKNPELFFSARREGIRSGRMGSFIGLV